MANTTWTPELSAAMKRFKSALTRAENRSDWRKVIEVADSFEHYFDERDLPLPDNWARWARAKEDAEFKLTSLKGSTIW